MRFVLVHGGYHGAWCWDKVVPELQALGHEAVAVELPGAGARVKEEANVESWRGAMIDVVEDGDVLVGHSMGGFVISMAADAAPEKVSRLIYLAAAVPIEGVAMAGTTPTNDYWRGITGLDYEEYTRIIETPEQGPVIKMTRSDAANKLFYHDCSPEDQAWAFEHLTPLPAAAVSEPLSLPRFWEAPIPRDFIVCTDDRSHPMEWDNEFMGRLGLTTCRGIVASHSPFISRPVETARIFDACVGETT